MAGTQSVQVVDLRILGIPRSRQTVSITGSKYDDLLKVCQNNLSRLGVYDSKMVEQKLDLYFRRRPINTFCVRHCRARAAQSI